MSLSNTGPTLYCVELRTANWDAMLHWYRHVVGLRVMVRTPEDGFALLMAGESRVSLLRRDLVGPASDRVSLALDVDDLQAIVTRLREHGDEVSVQSTSEGFREAIVCDPDANRIRLFTWPDFR